MNPEVRTRIWMGLVMAALAGGVLVVDHHLAGWLERPFYPCLFVAVTLLVTLSSIELHALLSAHSRPPLWLILASCLLVTHAVWVGHDPWRSITWAIVGVILVSFLYEMARFREPGGIVTRLSLLLWMVGYLGVLPAFFVLVRFWPEGSPALAGVAAMTMVIFVTKGADIGAFFTGRAIGRHRMSPLLSPKKTWEGLAGGLVLSMLIAVGVNRFLAPILSSDGQAALFGLTVGGAGVLGDLAESLIKRDCMKKDASQTVPGFGGVLDVVDSVLFAAPVAYWWFS